MDNLSTIMSVVYHIAIVGFVYFHIVVVLYILNLDKRWKVAKKYQELCGKYALEQDTVRWKMMKEFQNSSSLSFVTVGTIPLGIILAGFFIFYLGFVIKRGWTSFKQMASVPFIEKFAIIPPQGYIAAILLTFLTITIVNFATAFGMNAGQNKLMSEMTDYVATIENLKTQIFSKVAQPRDSDLGISLLRDSLVNKIMYIENTDDKTSADLMLRSMSPEDAIRYVQFYKDSSDSVRIKTIYSNVIRCSQITEELRAFSESDLKTFETHMRKLVVTPFNINTWRTEIPFHVPAHAKTLQNYLYTITEDTVSKHIDKWFYKSSDGHVFWLDNNILKSEEDAFNLYVNTNIVSKICATDIENTFTDDMTSKLDINLNELASQAYGDPSSKLRTKLMSFKIYFIILLIVLAYFAFHELYKMFDPVATLLVSILLILCVSSVAFFGRYSE